MASPPPFTLGTVTLTHDSAAIVGNGTGWEINGIRGGLMTVEVAGANTLVLASVADDTHATAATKWMGPSGTYNYAISMASADAADTIWASRHWSRVVGQALLAGIVPVASGTLAERDALDPQPANGEWFAHAEPPYDLTFYRKVPAGWEGPYQFRGEGGGEGGKGDQGDMSYGVVATVTDPDATVQPGGFEIDDYVTTAGTMNVAFARIRDGDEGAEVDFYIAVNGAVAYGPAIASTGSPHLTDGAGIVLSIGDRIAIVVTSVTGGDVRDFFAKIGIGAVA